VWINNSNSVSGTYKNLSLKCDGNAEMNNTTITKLGVNSDTNASYAINANGSVNLTSGSTYKINGTNISLYVPNMDASFNDVIVDTLKITSDAIQGSSQNLITADDTDFNFFTYGGGAIFTSGTDNASCGIYAMGNIETGSSNSGFGSRANGVRNGSKNTACGTDALVNFETGDGNSAFGNEALKFLGATTGTYNNNLALGESALKWINGGNSNIGIGLFSGIYYTSGGVPITSQQTGYDNNIFIGNLSGFSSVGGSHTNSIVIGNNQIITASNKIFLGSSAQETIFNGGCNIKASTNLTLNGNIIANSLTISPTEIGYLDGLTTNINTKFGDIDTFEQNTNDTLNALAGIVAYKGFVNIFTDDNTFTEITTFDGASVFNGDSAFNLNTSFNGTTTATFLNTVNMSGATSVTVPTVATGTNSTACASTSYVKNNLANYLSLAGTQTITGNKTITGTTSISGTTTFTGSTTHNQAFTVSNRTVSTGYNTSIDSKNVTIKADYDNNIGNGLFLQVETPVNQVQFNYPTYYATSAIVGAGASFQVGNVYGSASFVVFDGTFSISETNGQFLSNTLTALTNSNAVVLYPSVTNSISIGNSASSQDVIINGNIKQNNYYRFKINPTLITSTTTLSSPFYKINKFAMTTASGFTITLPEVNNSNLDMELTFKRQGGSLQILTIAQTNSQPIFGIGNSRGQITSSGMNNTQSLVSFVSTFVSPALTGNFTVTGSPTTTVNILTISSGAGSYITVGTTLTLAVGVTRIVTGYGTGLGGIGTYTVNTNITTNYTNQPYTATALYGWLATDLN